jgi:hypothetical protein
MEPTAMLPQPAAFVADRASPVSGKPPIPRCILVGQTARSACGGMVDGKRHQRIGLRAVMARTAWCGTPSERLLPERR